MAKIGILSDIHGCNNELEAALTELKDYGLIFNLGDVVSYHGDSNSVVNHLRQPNIISVKGGHETELSFTCNQDVILCDSGGNPIDINYGLTKENMTFLKSLPLIKTLRISEKQYSFMHGYISTKTPLTFDHATEKNVGLLLQRTGSDYVFVGHSHAAKLFEYSGNTAKECQFNQGNSISLPDSKKFVINVPNLVNVNGLEKILSYVTMDTTKKELCFHSRDYADVKKPTINIDYPSMGRGKWHQTSLSKNPSFNPEEEIYSKAYNCFFAKVKIIYSTSHCTIESKIFDISKGTYYSNSKKIGGKDCRRTALAYVVMQECPKVEEIIDSLTSPYKSSVSN